MSMLVSSESPVEWKVMPSKMVKQEMARTSSMLAAAITRLGIPYQWIVEIGSPTDK